MNFFNREELIFLELKANDVWFVRPQESELKVYNFSLVIAWLLSTIYHNTKVNGTLLVL